MQNKFNNLQDRAAQMINWLVSHPQVQSIICFEEYGACPEQCLEDMDTLAEAGYYELIYILLMKNRFSYVIGRVVEAMLMEAWAEQWESMGYSNMVGKIKTRIKAELAVYQNKKQEKA